jgi:hypothetical protein
MRRKQKLEAIKGANERINGALTYPGGHQLRVTEVYPLRYRRMGYVAQISTFRPGPEKGVAEWCCRRFDPEQLERLNRENVYASVFEGTEL